jgi:hypothetical protein
MRTVRSRSSLGCLDLLMAPSPTHRSEPPRNPGRFRATTARVSWEGQGRSDLRMTWAVETPLPQAQVPRKRMVKRSGPSA